MQPFDRSTSSRLRVGKRGAWPCLPSIICGASFRAPPAISVSVRSAARDRFRRWFWPCPSANRHGRPIRLDLPGPAYVLVQHARAVVPAGDPLDGTSPAAGHVGHVAGGAGPSPLEHRRELRSRREGRGHYAGGVWGGDKTSANSSSPLVGEGGAKRRMRGFQGIRRFGRHQKMCRRRKIYPRLIRLDLVWASSARLEHPSSDLASLGHLLPQGREGGARSVPPRRGLLHGAMSTPAAKSSSPRRSESPDCAPLPRHGLRCRRNSRTSRPRRRGRPA